MNRLLDNDVDHDTYGYAGRRRSILDDADPPDREISLGTPTILGIFFVLALVCAAFFGFGYSIGRRSVPAPTAAIEPPTAPAAGIEKPMAGSPAAPPETPADAVTEQPAAATVSVPTEAEPPAKAPAAAEPTATVPKAVSASPAVQPAAAVPAGSFVVQVAAVTGQDVADILTSSLQKKGYTVAVRHEPTDKLLHVQIGPFADRKQAEAMRQRVMADGFNAIVK